MLASIHCPDFGSVTIAVVQVQGHHGEITGQCQGLVTAGDRLPALFSIPHELHFIIGALRLIWDGQPAEDVVEKFCFKPHRWRAGQFVSAGAEAQAEERRERH